MVAGGDDAVVSAADAEGVNFGAAEGFQVVRWASEVVAQEVYACRLQD